MKMAYRGMQTTIITLPLESAVKLITAGKVRIGLVVCRFRDVSTAPIFVILQQNVLVNTVDWKDAGSVEKRATLLKIVFEIHSVCCVVGVCTLQDVAGVWHMRGRWIVGLNEIDTNQPYSMGGNSRPVLKNYSRVETTVVLRVWMILLHVEGKPRKKQWQFWEMTVQGQNSTASISAATIAQYE